MGHAAFLSLIRERVSILLSSQDTAIEIFSREIFNNHSIVPKVEQFSKSQKGEVLTDCSQRDEAKVSGIEEWPLLPSTEEERTPKYVTDHQEHAQPNWYWLYRLPVLVLYSRVVLIIRVEVIGINLPVKW